MTVLDVVGRIRDPREGSDFGICAIYEHCSPMVCVMCEQVT